MLLYSWRDQDFPFPYISKWERLAFPFLNSVKTFLGFPFPSLIAGIFFKGIPVPFPKLRENCLTISVTVPHSRKTV